MKSAAPGNIVIIGCGNLAWHLASKIAELKTYKLHVYNHRPTKALAEFKTKFKCATSHQLSNILPTADFYFLCVPDRAVGSISGKVSMQGIVVHCSGTKHINSINTAYRGVFYPLQTFSKKDKVNWNEVPILIEGTDKKTEHALKHLAAQFSKNVVVMNSEERVRFHLAAVIVNNFSNALYAAADNFLQKNSKTKKPFELLKPLINQGVKKLEKLSPKEAQTGPASRGDKEVIKQHLQLLGGDKKLRRIYKQLSKLIEQQHA